MTFAVVGGWGANRGGTSPGLSVFRVDLHRTTAELTDVAPLVSPSFVVAPPSRPWVFTATEEDTSRVLAYAVDRAGRLGLRSEVNGAGSGACHLALAPDGRHLVVAHYRSGAVTNFPVADDGTLGAARNVLAFTGSGPDPVRQAGPHAHQVLWTGNHLLVCDLGADRVHRLRLDDHGRFGEAGPAIRLPPGSGPRHAAVVGGLLVVVLELSAEVWVGRRTPGGWTQTQRLAASGRSAPNLPSAIATDGRRVFVANRGPDTLTELAVTGGRLTRVAEHPSGGQTPRNLLLADNHLWVSHQDSDEVVVRPLPDLSVPPALRLPVSTPTAVALVGLDTTQH